MRVGKIKQELIWKYYRNGSSIEELSALTGMTNTTIRGIINTAVENEKKEELMGEWRALMPVLLNGGKKLR